MKTPCKKPSGTLCRNKAANSAQLSATVRYANIGQVLINEIAAASTRPSPARSAKLHSMTTYRLPAASGGRLVRQCRHTNPRLAAWLVVLETPTRLFFVSRRDCASRAAWQVTTYRVISTLHLLLVLQHHRNNWARRKKTATPAPLDH